MKKSARAARQNARPTARTDHAGDGTTCQTGSLPLTGTELRPTLPRNSEAPLPQPALSEFMYRPERDENAAQTPRSVCKEAAEHSNLGASLEALGRDGQAEAAYRRAIALDPGLARVIALQNRARRLAR